MANEIRTFQQSGSTLYTCVRNASGQVWYVVGQTFETWGTSSRDADDYDIALTDKSGSMYVGDMDANISAGYYTLLVYNQAGANPADTDYLVTAEDVYWDGSTMYRKENALQTIKAKTDLIPASPAAVGSAMTLAANAVSASALATDAVTEIWSKAMSDLAAGAPSATCSVLTAINYLYEVWRNKVTVSSSEMTIYKDDGSTGLCKSSVADNGTLYTKGEVGAV